jgi:hypothetical protein
MRHGRQPRALLPVMLIHALTNAGILALLSMAVVLGPLFLGVAYALKPTEARLALMRPLSLAAIFAALTGIAAGAINTLVGVGSREVFNYHVVMASAAESLVPMFVGFGCLTIAWLCVALGLRRQS